jgi:hypothetical protein
MKATVSSLLMVACIFAAGCQTDVYRRAGALAGEVREHRDRQAARVSKINADFDARFTTLMDQYGQALNTQLRQGRDADAQRIADELVVDLENSGLRGRFREAFARVVVSQRDSIAEADEAVAAARAAYETSYQQASLELKRLDRVHDILLELAAVPDELRVANRAIRMTVNAYKKAQDEQQTQNAAGGGDGNGGESGGS